MTRSGIELAVLALALAAFFALGFFLGRGRKPAPETVIKTETDTLYLRDTITAYKPVYIARTVVSRDTFRVVDTLRERDTLYLAMDRESVEWRDSLCTVFASGVRPSVDSVRHYVTEKIVTVTERVPVRKVTRWGVGVQAGYGISDKGLTPYIGAGISYNLLAW